MKSFGRYQVLRSLAQAGVDARFLAQTIDAGVADHHVVRAIEDRTFEEARRAAWLRHPNLVSVRELGAAAGRWYVATEYVHGEDLRRVLARVRRGNDQVPIALVTAIGAAVAAGLHHAHTHHGPRRTRRGSVHGGVSPASILIGYDGSVKVADLGVAAAADAAYLAPEQVTGEPIDRRTDVFALGAVLYELATARRLFKAPSDALTRAAVEHANIPPPSRFRRGLPRALEGIILKALARSPADRFKSAGELGAALEAFTQRLGMRASPACIADYLKKLFGARPLPWLPPTRASARAALDELDAEIDTELDDREQLGVAAPPAWVLRELGVPEARALEATPPRGTKLPGKTPMSWTCEADAAPSGTLRRLGLMAGASVAAGLAGFLLAGAIVGGGSDPAAATMSAPPPPPPPPPPSAIFDASPGDASPGDGSAAELAPRPPPQIR